MSFIGRIFKALFQQTEQPVEVEPTVEAVTVPQPVTVTVPTKKRARPVKKKIDATQVRIEEMLALFAAFLKQLQVWHKSSLTSYKDWDAVFHILVNEHSNGKQKGALPQQKWVEFGKQMQARVCGPFETLAPLFELVSRHEVRSVYLIRTTRERLDQRGLELENTFLKVSRSLDSLKKNNLHGLALSFDPVALSIGEVRQLISADAVDSILRNPPDTIVITNRYCIESTRWRHFVEEHAESRKYKFRYGAERITLYDLSKTIEKDVIDYCDSVEQFSLMLLTESAGLWARDFLKLERQVGMHYGHFLSAFSYQTNFLRLAYPQYAYALSPANFGVLR